MRSINYKFYKSWKNKTPLEKKYIEALEKALEWMKKQNFIKKVIAIYVKGSFVFREINEKSDIDVVPVLIDNQAAITLRKMRNKNKEWLKPVEIIPFPIEELRTNKRFKKENLKKPKGEPDHFTLLFKYHKLIYGKPLNPKKWKRRSNKQVYADYVKRLKNQMLPLHESGNFGFQQIVKQIGIIFYWEAILSGKNLAPSWRDMIKNCKHPLFKRTFYLRYHPTKDEKIRKEYLDEVKKYLDRR